MLFFYKFFTFFQLFSQHSNKFYYRKFQNHSQISLHRTNHSQNLTPHTTETPIQPTAANFDNQKPQPPKHHYHTTITTTKIKITQREKSVGRRLWVEGEVERRGAICVVLRSTRPVQSGTCDRQTRARGSPATSKVWSGLPPLSLSLSPKIIWSENRNRNEFQWSKLPFTVKWKWFPENYIFKTNQTAYFIENDFLKPFTPIIFSIWHTWWKCFYCLFFTITIYYISIY